MKTAQELIPGRLNLVLCLVAIGVCCLALYGASHATAWWGIIAWAVVFGFVNNTIFSLIHEAVHGILHSRWVVNEMAGAVLAGFFPTALTPQRAFHLAHHRNNRTDLEFFDGYYPGDNLFLKRMQWYGIITGEYWLHNPVACVLWLLCPWVLRRPGLRDDDRQTVRQHGAAHMLAALDRLDPWRSRLEVVLMLAVQAGLWLALDLSLIGWIACYAAFAFLWGSLQYADHAFSPRDVRNGAWNLRVTWPVRWIFLNYHHHLAHHQRPSMPWLYLGRYVPEDSHRPWFWAIYLKMWLGPRPAEGSEPIRDEALEQEVDVPFSVGV